MSKKETRRGEESRLTFLGRIASYFINTPQMTILTLLIMITLGSVSLFILPKESLPEIVFPTLTVQSLYPGASALDVEQLVTDPIEIKLSGLDDLEDMVSESSAGVSFITMTFLESVDIQKKELEVDSLLSEVVLPAGLDTPNASIFKTSELPLLTFSVTGGYSLATLTEIGEDIRSSIESIGAVDEVGISGGTSREIQVSLDWAKIYALDLTVDDVKNALQAQNISLPVGEEVIGDLTTSLSIDSRFETVEQIGETLIVGSKGQNVFLDEIAVIKDTTSDIKRLNRTYYLDNPKGSEISIYGTVLRKKGADVLATSAKVKALIANGKGTVYPPDVEVGIVYDNARNVSRDLSNIQVSAVSGLLVVVLVLFLFIGLKESFIVSITIPLSLMTAIGLLGNFGISLNTFAILGLIVSLGLLVDNSIIVMENMDRLSRMGYTPMRAALEGTNQVSMPILASTLTTVAAFLPLAILPGILGSFVNTIPRTIILALVSSLVISITVTPSIYALVMSRMKRRIYSSRRRRFNRIVGLGFVILISYAAFYDSEAAWWLPIAGMIFFTSLMIMKIFLLKDKSIDESKLVRRYELLLKSLLEKTWRQVLVLALGLFVLISSISLIPLGLLKVNFFPQNEPTSLTIKIDTPSGTTLEGTLEIVEQVESILESDSAIAVFNSNVGGQVADYAVIDATMSDKSGREVSGFEVVSRIDQSIRRIAGAEITVSGSAGGGPPVGKPVVIELNAQDYEAGRMLAQNYKNKLEQIPGVYNVQLSVTDGKPGIDIVVNAPKAVQYGLSVSAVASQVRNSLDGTIATTLKSGQELIDVRIVSRDSELEGSQKLQGLMIRTPQGASIPLSLVADFNYTQGLSSIRHDNTVRVIVLDADVLEGYNAGDITDEFMKSIENIEKPFGVDLKLSGDAEGIQDSFLNLFRSMIAAVLLVFLILAVQFKSIAQPFAILTTVPMALVGVFFGLVVTGNEFGFYAFFGLVSLVGIAVNDAIVLIDFMNQLRNEGKALIPSIIEAGKTRFNPVLATTMTTIGGVLPLSFREVYYAQFSYSLVFGLLITTVMTLILIPIVYHLIEKSKEKSKQSEKGVA
ncbi:MULTISPECIES: efflux RND transporter permease subunit [unclassified Fusibacter]|uniref:efflux RND transporter permease subunit n=1 Tax=unclassified Fusibacter TaxID=2624464 RepID=UPI0010113FA1|nr:MULTISPECIES: efflux RND transporter permease subunit [unclassified Fusibacter]MCK8061203.1 efflux RND transporter permease subunit [Fusibacter sp. A2]NPE23453.1 efflux RND transporter permease subunit [Fusibacter sp. A1]RXV59231.1 AcrB/AcrD/AcrF family protein [Fusibacter sp. A1]